MTPAERSHYHVVLWPAACRAQGWQPKDPEKRRAAVLACMAAVSGPAVTTSDARFGRDEVTALFCFLQHLADPASLDKSARWVTCQQDYRTYNRARQADWHERKLYGAGKNKLDRNRFGGTASAAGGALDDLDPEAVRKRFITMASRHQRKMRTEKGQKLASTNLASGGLATKDETQQGGHHAPEPEKPADTHAATHRAGPPGAVPAWAEEGDGNPF